MKVCVLSILINSGTSDQEYDMVAVCKSIDKCKEKAVEELKHENKKLNDSDLIVGELKKDSKDIFKFIVTENNKYDTTFKIWETELL